MNFDNPQSGDIWPYRYKYFGSAGVECGKKKNRLRNVRVIGEHKLWYSAPSSLNDPFDCSPNADERSMDKLIEMAGLMYRKYPGLHYPDDPELTEPQIIKRLALEYSKLHSGDGFVEDFFSWFSILCLTRNPVNQLMWSHYGNSHKGFVLEFSLMPALELDPHEPKNLAKLEKCILTTPVRYSDSRPHFDSDNSTDMFTTKSKIWQYELEERITRHQPAGYGEYDPECLSSVIIGMFAPDSLKDQIRYQISKLGDKGKHIKIYQTQKHKSDYRIWIPDHPYYGNSDFKDNDSVWPPFDPETLRTQ